MRQLSIGQKLQAIGQLRLGIELSMIDHCDIADWIMRVGEKWDTTVLCDLAVERISSIYHSYFE